MAGTHGDLYSEIGRLVLAAHAGQAIDLTSASEELARRYINLGVPADILANAIARSLGAVGVSLARVRGIEPGLEGEDESMSGEGIGDGRSAMSEPDADEQPVLARSASVLLPSGVRLAVLA